MNSENRFNLIVSAIAIFVLGMLGINSEVHNDEVMRIVSILAIPISALMLYFGLPKNNRKNSSNPIGMSNKNTNEINGSNSTQSAKKAENNPVIIISHNDNKDSNTSSIHDNDSINTRKESYFDENGYDKNGFDKYGWNRDEWNKDGINKFTGTKYNRFGFDQNNWNSKGVYFSTYSKFNSFNEDKDGFNLDGWDKNAINKYTSTLFDKAGYNLSGFNKDGWTKDAKKTKTFLDKYVGYNIHGFDKLGLTKEKSYIIEKYDKLIHFIYKNDYEASYVYARNLFENIFKDVHLEYFKTKAPEELLQTIEKIYSEMHMEEVLVNLDAIKNVIFIANDVIHNNKVAPVNDDFVKLQHLAQIMITGFYNKFIWNKEGFNSYGIHKITGSIYNPKGYDMQGYSMNGYDHEGFDKNGYDIHMFNREGFSIEGFDREGYDKYGFDNEGYNKDGWNKDGINKYTQTPLGRDGLDRYGYDKNGWNKDELHRDTFSEFDSENYNKYGFHFTGIHRKTKTKFDENGYNIFGFNQQGFNYLGFNKNGLYKDLITFRNDSLMDAVQVRNALKTFDAIIAQKSTEISIYDVADDNIGWMAKQVRHSANGIIHESTDKLDYDMIKKLSIAFSKNYGEIDTNMEIFDSSGWSNEDHNKYTKSKFNLNGYDREGYDKDGWSLDGINKTTLTEFDIYGFNRNGLNKNNFDKDGYHITGFNVRGYDKNGYDKNGYNSAGVNKNNCDRLGRRIDPQTSLMINMYYHNINKNATEESINEEYMEMEELFKELENL